VDEDGNDFSLYIVVINPFYTTIIPLSSRLSVCLPYDSL
jgi:hypothetical protein